MLLQDERYQQRTCGMQAGLLSRLRAALPQADARGPESLPQKDWDEIRAKTRKSYLDSFNKVMNVLNSQGASEPVLLDKSEKSVSTKVEEKDGDTKEK